MSRAGYSEDADGWKLIRWRGAVASAIRGARGQSFLREMLTALDALAEKELIRNELEEDGAVCALGAVGKSRGVDMSEIDPFNREMIAAEFGIADAMAAEIMYENDEMGSRRETPQARFARMRAWIVSQLRATEGSAS